MHTDTQAYTELLAHEFTVTLGTIAGRPVLGEFCDNNTEPTYGVPWAVRYEVGEDADVGIDIDTRNDAMWVRLPVKDDGCGYTLADFGRLRELVTSGIVEQMIPLAREFARRERLPVTPREPAPRPERPALSDAEFCALLDELDELLTTRPDRIRGIIAAERERRGVA